MPKFPTADEWGNTRTPYAVVCSAGCGLVYLTADEYGFQLNRPDSRWECPQCRNLASWSDENYDEMCSD